MAGWADLDDDSDDDEQQQQTVPLASSKKADGSLVIPPTHKSRADAKGIQIVTSYRANPNNPNTLLKTTSKVRVTKDIVRENVMVDVRRRWKKFGQAALDEDTSNVTIVSRDDVYLEDPNADTDLQDEDPAKAMAGNLNAFWAKQQERQLRRKYDVDEGAEGGAAAAGGGWTQVGASASAGGASSGRYVPPGARGGGAAAGSRMPERQDDLNTIRVTNVSESTTEADLQDLFQPFENDAVDERIVKSKHGSGIQQYMKNKPIKFGLKLWVLADSATGYTHDFTVYKGSKVRDPNAIPITENSLVYDVVCCMLYVQV